MLQLSATDLAEHLRKALDGSLAITLVNSNFPWGYSGNVPFMIGGWKVTFFNDCGELDYVDDAQTMDGRESSFDDWDENPLDHLGWNEQAKLQTLLENAR